MVYLSALKKIEEQWKAAGSPRCEHKRTERERFDFAGVRSGDLGCLDCGESWSAGDPKPEPRGGGDEEPSP